MHTVEILQCDGFWSASSHGHATFMHANEQAVLINEQHFTATRVLDDMGHVVLYVLPQFPEVAYPGPSCVAARKILAVFKA